MVSEMSARPQKLNIVKVKANLKDAISCLTSPFLAVVDCVFRRKLNFNSRLEAVFKTDGRLKNSSMNIFHESAFRDSPLQTVPGTPSDLPRSNSRFFSSPVAEVPQLTRFHTPVRVRLPASDVTRVQWTPVNQYLDLRALTATPQLISPSVAQAIPSTPAGLTLSTPSISHHRPHPQSGTPATTPAHQVARTLALTPARHVATAAPQAAPPGAPQAAPTPSGRSHELGAPDLLDLIEEQPENTTAEQEYASVITDSI